MTAKINSKLQRTSLAWMGFIHTLFAVVRTLRTTTTRDPVQNPCTANFDPMQLATDREFD